MQVIDNKALLLKLRQPEKVTSVIPKSKLLPDNRVLVNWGIEETHVLKNLNIKAPSPIEAEYEWTGKHEPFDHQKTTSSFLTLNKRAFCFNEQGTGKTASAIWASDYLLKQVSDILKCELSNFKHKALHFWKYAMSEKNNNLGSLLDEDLKVIVCGDWCMNGKVEGGFLSAKDAAKKLIKYI